MVHFDLYGFELRGERLSRVLVGGVYQLPGDQCRLRERLGIPLLL
jgi:hypothetical protein